MASTLSFNSINSGATNPIVLNNCNVTELSQEPEYAEDDRALIYRKIKVTGQCLIGADDNAYLTMKNLARNSTGMVSSWAIDVGGVNLFTGGTASDALNRPSLWFTTTEIKGTKSILVSFTAEAFQTLRFSGTEAGTVAPVAHRWTQEFRINDVGTISRIVRGSLYVDLSTTGATTVPPLTGSLANITGISPNADLFRYAIIPTVPSGATDGNWIRESQTFAYNERGNGLVYEITDKQVRTALPSPAKTGNCSFTYERNRSSLGQASLTFECTLNGEVNGDVRKLIWAALRLSTMRINPAQCQYQRVVVVEQDMLTSASIRLTIEAVAFAEPDNTPLTGELAVPLAAYIGRKFGVTRPACAQIVLPYGTRGLGFSALRHQIQNTLSGNTQSSTDGFPIAQASMFRVTAEPECDDSAAPTVAFLTDSDFADLTSANAVLNVGPYKDTTQNLTSTDGQQGRFIQAVSSFTKVNVLTKVHRLETMYTDISDYVFQCGKPIVEIEETLTVKRMNFPPPRQMRPIPAGFTVHEEDWSVNYGQIDAGGNRSFTGVWTRRIRGYDIGGQPATNGYVTQANAGGDAYRAWWAPNNLIVPATAAGQTGVGQDTTKTVLQTQSTGNPTYSTGNAQPYESGYA